MKKTILILAIVFSGMLAQAQNDVIYSDNTIILDCQIKNVSGHTVTYIKEGFEKNVDANKIIHNGISIELTGLKKPNQIQFGDKIEGGIVFSVNESEQTALIAAPYDQTDKKVRWGSNGRTNAFALNNGYENTKLILDNMGGSQSAAKLCESLTLNGYDDWYLPAIKELRLMYDNQSTIGGFKQGDYCSSTEYGRKDAYSIHFRPHRRIEYYYNKIDRNYFVRCIRKVNLNKTDDKKDIKDTKEITDSRNEFELQNKN